jgi:N-acetylmuramoyl-L-alanine amidase
VLEYWRARRDTFGSAHYIIDEDETVQAIPDSEIALGVGGPLVEGAEWLVEGLDSVSQIAHSGYSPQNFVCLNIELVPLNADGEFHGLVVNRAIQLAARLCSRHSINPAVGLLRHFDVTGKLCPRRWVEEPAEWEEFRQDVARSSRRKR